MPQRDETLPRNTFTYFFREASRRMWVSKRTSFVAIAMIAISLLIVGGFLLVADNLGRAVAQAEGKSRVNIYLDVDSTTQQIAAIDNWLAVHRDFTGRRFVSKEAALARFRQYFANLTDVVGQLDENPFPASFEGDVPPGIAQSAAFQHQAAELRATAGVEQVQFDWCSRAEGPDPHRELPEDVSEAGRDETGAGGRAPRGSDSEQSADALTSGAAAGGRPAAVSSAISHHVIATNMHLDSTHAESHTLAGATVRLARINVDGFRPAVWNSASINAFGRASLSYRVLH